MQGFVARQQCVQVEEPTALHEAMASPLAMAEERPLMRITYCATYGVQAAGLGEDLRPGDCWPSALPPAV